MAKKTRILLSLLLVLVMVFTAACTAKDADSEPDDDKGSSSLSDKFGKDDKDDKDDDTTEPSMDFVVTTDPAGDDETQPQLDITDTVLYDQDGIKVTVTGYEKTFFGPEITVLVENNTDKNVTVSTEHLSVNGYMFGDVMLYADVPAGKKANDSLMFSDEDLEKCGIQEISKLEFCIEVSDTETYDTIAMSELLTLNLTAQCNQKVDDSGVELYNKDGIRIIYKGTQASDLFDGIVDFFVENKSGRDISIYAKDISINGFACDDSFWADLRDGTVALESMILWDLSKVNLESVDQIENIELKFRVIDYESWDELTVTDTVTINIEK